MQQTTGSACLIILTLCGAGLAMSDAAQQADVNGDGLLTREEVRTSYPAVTTKDFMAMDLNADGTLDGREVTAAEEAGMIPSLDRGG